MGGSRVHQCDDRAAGIGEGLIARCRAAGKTIVAGGPLFTTEHEQFSGVDHFVLNEAEVTLPEFLSDLEQGKARPVYTSAELPDIRQTPAPLWELADFRRYASMCIQYSRGCPFDCEFCSVTAMFGHRPRVKTPAQIITELDGLWRRGWRGAVFFVDDNLIGNKRSLREELLPALIRWRQGRRGFAFYTEASINLADDEELMQMMARSLGMMSAGNSPKPYTDLGNNSQPVATRMKCRNSLR